MMNHDQEVHERHRDELQDRRERGAAQGELGGEGERGQPWRAALGEHGSTEHLLALKVDAMEVTVVTEPTQLGHVVLALVETSTGRGFSVSLTPLELEVLAFGLGRVAARMQKESERR